MNDRFRKKLRVKIKFEYRNSKDKVKSNISNNIIHIKITFVSRTNFTSNRSKQVLMCGHRTRHKH